MAKRLTFSEFKDALANRLFPLEVLSDYLEFDPDSPIPKLVFRHDALLDIPDPEYNVDMELYKYLQELEEKEYFQSATFQLVARETVVAEGDSWYNLPSLLRPPAIADWIKINRRFRMRNIAYWGHTISKIHNEKQYMQVLDRIRPTFFMLCGGGNDLQKGLSEESYLHSYDPDRSPDDYLTNEGIAGIEKIKHTYIEILTEVVSKFPATKVLCHGYDYPRPLVGQGKYIGQYLRLLNIPDDAMNSIVVGVVNRLNVVILEAIESFSTVEFVELRCASAAYTWYDDMHPSREGFRALAKKFEDAMS